MLLPISWSKVSLRHSRCALREAVVTQSQHAPGGALERNPFIYIYEQGQTCIGAGKQSAIKGKRCDRGYPTSVMRPCHLRCALREARETSRKRNRKAEDRAGSAKAAILGQNGHFCPKKRNKIATPSALLGKTSPSQKAAGALVPNAASFMSQVVTLAHLTPAQVPSYGLGQRFLCYTFCSTFGLSRLSIRQTLNR